MCEDEGTRGGDGTAEVLKMGSGGLCQWFQWGGGQWMIKWGR